MLKTILLSFQQRPYLLFILAAIALLIYSFFDHHQTMDIHVDDTMFVISSYLVYWLMAFCFIIAAGLYAGLKRFLPNRVLTWTHILLTLLVLLSTSFFISYYNNIYASARGDISSGSMRQTVNYFETSESVYRWLILLLLAAQLIFIGHIVGGIILFTRKKQ